MMRRYLAYRPEETGGIRGMIQAVEGGRRVGGVVDVLLLGKSSDKMEPGGMLFFSGWCGPGPGQHFRALPAS